MRSVRFTPAARADLLEAYDWYHAILPELGDRFRDEIDDAVGRIRSNPRLFAEIHRDIRRALLKKFPYGLFYRLEQDDIFVIACFHSNRDPQIWKRRK